MMTIAEYASKHKVSYEAVRSQVVRYKDELSEHISIRDRKQYLDDWAVAFLDERRREHPVTVINTSRNEEIERLQAEIEKLQAKVFDLQEERNTAHKRIEALQDEARAFLEDKIKYSMFLEDYQTRKDQFEQAVIEAATATAKLEEVQKSADYNKELLLAAEAATREERDRADQIRSAAEADKARLTEERDAAIKESQSYKKVFGIFYRKV